MTREEINRLVRDAHFPSPCEKPECIETHISWVILCGEFVYKIKKPIRYTFLDFSTPESRKHYCEREVILNRRLAGDMYLDVLPVMKSGDTLSVGGRSGSGLDWAVRMRRQDRARQMDILLRKKQVTGRDMERLAHMVAGFHRSAMIVRDKNPFDIRDKFRDLAGEMAFLEREAEAGTGKAIRHAVERSDDWVDEWKELFKGRLKDGFYRDGHGDLHARNIFLGEKPVIFDCIEFSDDFRQTDVLNEVAFLCMDLEAFGERDLSDMFIRHYNASFPAIRGDEEQRLFIYFKSYRANVRAKVNSLRARSAQNPDEKELALAEVRRYLRLMQDYLEAL